MNKKHYKKFTPLSKVVSAIFVVLCIAWIMPIFEVVINSFKSNASINTNAFSLPTAESFDIYLDEVRYCKDFLYEDFNRCR